MTYEYTRCAAPKIERRNFKITGRKYTVAQNTAMPAIRGTYGISYQLFFLFAYRALLIYTVFYPVSNLYGTTLVNKVSRKNSIISSTHN